MKLVQMLACAGVVMVASCAAPETVPTRSFAQSSGHACFRANEVYGYAPGPDGLVDVQTAEGPFRLRLAPGCPAFSMIMEIGIRPMQSSWLCEGKTDELITGSPVATNLCTVSEIERLGPHPMSEG